MKILVLRVSIANFCGFEKFYWFGIFPDLFVRACVHVCVCGCDSVRGHIGACVRVYICVEG